jgi:Mu-like prophage I protein
VADLPGVELARPGTWRLSTGTTTFTEAMLRDAADFYAATGATGIPIAPGHTDDRWDGDPSFGRVVNIRYAEDAAGPVLLGDLVDMDDWVAAAAPKRWPNRSVEGWQGFEFQGRTYSLALTKLALLGSAPPAIPNLRALQEAVAAAAAASGGVRIAASAPTTDPSPGPEVPPDAQEGAGMDPAKIREALGLPADASDDDVRTALAAAGLAPPAPADPAPPVKDDAPKPVDLPADVPQPLAAAAAAAGAVVLDKGVWDQAQTQIAEGVAAARKLREQDRDQLLGQAVQDGRIPPANRGYWATLWDRDPKGTAEVVATLRRNLVPVMATGYTGSDDEDGPDQYDHLFPPTAKG